MLPDVSGIDKAFDYAVPRELAAHASVGSLVRVPLGPRKVRGWITDLATAPPAGVDLRPLIELSSFGPSTEVVDLARWASWRWAGRMRPFLLAASPPRRVRDLPSPGRRRSDPGSPAAEPDHDTESLVTAAAGAGVSVVRLPPAASRLPLVLEALRQTAGSGDALVLVPTRAEASRLASLLGRAGHDVALEPDGWAAAAAGGRVVVGTRNAAFAPCPRLAALVVLDAHADAYVETRAPTWNAAVVAAERAKRSGVPCLLVSPCPTLELLACGALHTVGRAAEREGWPVLEVIDRRGDDPRSGRYSSRLAALARAAASDAHGPVVFVLNRTGRARLLACAACGQLARCEWCGTALRQLGERAEGGQAPSAVLECPSCGKTRPVICAECGSTRMKVLRVGTGKAREEVAALTGLETVEITAQSDDLPAGTRRPAAVVGTEAALHRLPAASLVAFVDIDQELMAPRFRASEQGLALLASAARLVGGRSRGRRLAVQTRLPDHEVIRSAVNADPGILAAAEVARRAYLRLPPEVAVAAVSGPGSPAFASELARRGTVEVAVLDDKRLLVRASDHRTLCDALETARRTSEHVRIEVDPSTI